MGVVETDIRTLILHGKFHETFALLAGRSETEIRDDLLLLGFDNQTLTPYSFLCFCLCQKESPETHYLASELLSTALCHIPGAYSSALFHTRRAIELSPDDVNLKEHLLLFHEIPEKLVTSEEARKVAEEIISACPESTAAKMILGL